MRLSEAMRRTGNAARATGGAVRSGARAGATATRRTGGLVHRVTGASGAGLTGLSTLIELTAAGGVGDAFVAVSLAGTIFFSTSVDQARGRVVLFLLVTMAPFAVLAPFIGPALDRMQQGRRYLLAGTLLARGLLCWGMSAAINSPVTLLPAAFGILVLQKAYGVARASITPRLLPEQITLVSANARSQLITLTASMLGGAVAAGIQAVAGAAWVLRAGTVIYLAAMVLALRLPDRVDVLPDPAATTLPGGGQGRYGDARGPYGDAQGRYGDARGPYGDARGPYGDAQGRYGDARGPYGDAQGRYGDARGPYDHARGPYDHARGPYDDARRPGAAAAPPPGTGPDGPDGYPPARDDDPWTGAPRRADRTIPLEPAAPGPGEGSPGARPSGAGRAGAGRHRGRSAGSAGKSGAAGGSRPAGGRTGAGRWRGLANVGPIVGEAMRGNAVLRAFSGYMVFFLAFLLRTEHFGVSHNVALGALVAAAAAGGLAAMAIGSLVRARAPQFILFAMLTLAPVVTAVCAWFFSLTAAIAVAFTAAMAAGLAKLALDSTVQREIGEQIRSSAFAVSETLNQVSNVAGGLAGVLVSMLDNGQVGLAIAAACLTAALVSLVAGRRRRVLALRLADAPPPRRPRRPG